MKKLMADLESRIISESDVNKALEISAQYGNLLWFADVGIYDAPGIESELIDRCFEVVNHEVFEHLDGCASVAHVISEPLLTGGHTRLMEKLAGMHEHPVDLIISRCASPRAELRVKSFFSKMSKVSADRPLDIVIQLVKLFFSYEKIVLHIHPDDICTVVACGVAKRLFGTEVFFVNHADHVFSYGTSVADYYFEISSYGGKLDLAKTIHGKKSFLGIPVKSSVASQNLDLVPDINQSLLFVSAGSDIKYKPNKGKDIFALVSRILDVYTSSRFLIIGTNLKTAFWWWPLKIKYRGRLEIRAHLEFDDYNKAVARADYYVDSHPIPGGTAFAEQYLNGQRCVGLVSPIQGYSPADKLKRQTVDEVLSSINEYLHSDSIFTEIQSVNGVENVKQRYLACLFKGQTTENLLDISNSWTGDVSFFMKDKPRSNIDVSVSSFMSLYHLGGGFALRLFRHLTFFKKIKLLFKILISASRLNNKVSV